MTLADDRATAPASCPVQPAYNPFRPEVVTDPYPKWEGIRHETPVFYSPQLGSYVAIGYDEIMSIMQDPESFSSAPSMPDFGDPPAELAAEFPHGFALKRNPALVNTDGATHRTLRGLMSAAFNRFNVSTREAHIGHLVDGLIESFDGDGHAELVSQLCLPLPIAVIVDLLALPPDSVALIPGWAQAALVLSDPTAEAAARLASARQWIGFEHFCRSAIASRRAKPGDDLLSTLLHASLDDGAGAGFTDDQLVSHLAELVLAASITTSQLLSHAIARLMQHPAQLAAVRDDPDLVPVAVEETLRQHTPTLGFFRLVTRDVVVGGVELPAGSMVQVMWGAANHDPDKFDRPAVFDLHRVAGTPHLSFGYGAHFCLGAPLARLQTKVLLQRVVRLDGLRLAGPDAIEYAPNPVMHTLVRLEADWDVKQ